MYHSLKESNIKGLSGHTGDISFHVCYDILYTFFYILITSAEKAIISSLSSCHLLYPFPSHPFSVLPLPLFSLSLSITFLSPLHSLFFSPLSLTCSSRGLLSPVVLVHNHPGEPTRPEVWAPSGSFSLPTHPPGVGGMTCTNPGTTFPCR